MLEAILAMSIMGILFGLGLAFASKIFKVEVDPKIEKILSALPGANCGVCGKAGCGGLAEAVAKGDASLTSCPVAGEEAYSEIANILGVEVESKEKKVARIRCGGGKRSRDKYLYEGVKTCEASNLLTKGQKLCTFSCLGFGDCVTICPFDAIYMGENNIPIVDYSKCTACGKCIEKCPKNIISLEIASEEYYVKCLSQDKADFVRNSCKVGCIGCKICEKLSKGAFIIENNLSKVDYAKVNKSTPFQLCVEKCPTKCIINILTQERVLNK